MVTFEPRMSDFNPETLGFIPFMLSLIDTDNAVVQFDKNYQYAGGWQSYDGFQMLPNGNMLYLSDEKPIRLMAEAKFRAETIRFYEFNWVAVVQRDGSFVVSRLDQNKQDVEPADYEPDPDMPPPYEEE